MFNLPTIARTPSQVLALILATALVAWSVGMTTTAQAANLVELSNTLTDSAPEAQSGHQFRFIVPAGSDITGDIEIEFPSGFTGVGSVVDGDVTIGGLSGGTATGDGQVVTIEGGTAAAEAVVTIDIADGVITNPSISDPSESFEFTVTTNTTDGTDIGKTRVVIIDTVLVTAIVETTFEFTITGVNESVDINGDDTTGTTTATTIPFGVLFPGVPEVLAQDMTVTSNAGNGFIVTVEQDQDLLSSTGAVISSFQDGSYENTATAWDVPGNDVNDDETWGHWGLTSDDTTLESLYPDFGLTGGYVAASTTPRLVFAHDASADGETQDIGIARVGYKIEVTALQEAAEDYTTTLTYIATPTF